MSYCIDIPMALTHLDILIDMNIVIFCIDIDECGSSPCDTDAHCADTEGSFTCTCLNGFAGDGKNCAGEFC